MLSKAPLMVPLEIGTGKSVSCVQPKGCEFGMSVPMDRRQPGHGRRHWEPDWVVVGSRLGFRGVIAAEGKLSPLQTAESPCSKPESSLLGSEDYMLECLISSVHHEGMEG